MGTQEGLEALVQQVEKIDCYIEKGLIPAGRRYFPRIAYVGHKVVYGVWQPESEREYRCVACMHDWVGLPLVCLVCGKSDNMVQLNLRDEVCWSCNICAHEWVSEDGEICPACGVHFQEAGT